MLCVCNYCLEIWYVCKLGKTVTFFGIPVLLLRIRVCPSGGCSYKYSIHLLFSYVCLFVSYQSIRNCNIQNIFFFSTVWNTGIFFIILRNVKNYVNKILCLDQSKFCLCINMDRISCSLLEFHQLRPALKPCRKK